MRKVIQLALGAILLVAIGCSPVNVVGKYKAKVEVPKDQKDNPAAALGEGVANAFAQLVTLDIRADNKFSMSMLLPIEGKWSLSGDTLTLTPESAMGMTSSNPGTDTMKFTVSDGGKTLTSKDSKPGEGVLILVRESGG